MHLSPAIPFDTYNVSSSSCLARFQNVKSSLTSGLSLRGPPTKMPPYSCTGGKYPRNNPRILKIVVPLRRRIGGVGQFTGGGEPWDDLVFS
jgi:hypothetical protein